MICQIAARPSRDIVAAGADEVLTVRLLYLIFDRLLNWLVLLARTSSSKNIELLVLRHVAAASPLPDLRRLARPRCRS